MTLLLSDYWERERGMHLPNMKKTSFEALLPSFHFSDENAGITAWKHGSSDSGASTGVCDRERGCALPLWHLCWSFHENQ